MNVDRLERVAFWSMVVAVVSAGVALGALVLYLLALIYGWDALT